ncbi:MAG: 16S rRNA (uracil(1498)-N(3))-methyltransferase [Alphaproteobacteria bacterium]|nr:16S rRNA (uracil(1498)-N(3))-methyltransferase [Alphaproteobacteria bacterium]
MDLRHTRRLFVPDRLKAGTPLTLAAEPAHRLIHVLRMREGDIIRLFNGHDGEFAASVTNLSKKEVALRVEEALRPQENGPDVWLCCAPIKKIHFDTMLEKATELGVSEIQPILTQRTQIRDVNGDRAYLLCREAAEQSERLAVPAIGAPVTLDDMVSVFPPDRALIVCAEWGNADPIWDALQQPALRAFSKAAILTGPEGGLTADELETLRHRPHTFFVRLGPRILRADTAALAALVCWQAIQGDWKTIG